MKVRELEVPDAYEVTPIQHRDERGVFLEWFVRDRFEQETGHHLPLAQANSSVSVRGVVRGIHFSEVPPGQAKYVTCVSGAVYDVVVDLRSGSPTFGHWDAARLDDENRASMYVAEGLGHAFMALSDRATVAYLCSEPYNPGREHAVNALDPDVGIRWPDGLEPMLSPKDSAAPTLTQIRAAGVLPGFTDCRAFYRRRRSD